MVYIIGGEAGLDNEPKKYKSKRELVSMIEDNGYLDADFPSELTSIDDISELNKIKKDIEEILKSQHKDILTEEDREILLELKEEVGDVISNFSARAEEALEFMY